MDHLSHFLCVLKVAYNEFDVTLPVVKRVQYLLRKVRDALAQDFSTSDAQMSGVPPVTNKESKLDTSKSAASDLLRQILKSDSSFLSEVRKIPTGTSEFDDGALKSTVQDSSTKETKMSKKHKKTKSLDVHAESTAETSDTVSGLASFVANGSSISDTRKSSAPLVTDKESKLDISKSTTPATNDFLREILKSDSFFLSDVEKIPAATSEIGDSASKSSVPDSGTKEAKTKTKKKKTKSLDVQAESTTSDTYSELASSFTTNEKVPVEIMTHKQETELSDLHVDSAAPAKSSSAVDEPSTTVTTKAKSRRKKTKSAASDDIITQSS